MTQATTTADTANGEAGYQLVSMVVTGQQLGVRIQAVREILGPQRLTRVPLAAVEIAGVFNRRGRVVTAIDLEHRLGLAGGGTEPGRAMHPVVEHAGTLWSLPVDRVGDILTPPHERLEHDPGGLPPAWRPLARGVHRLAGALLVELDVGRLLEPKRPASSDRPGVGHAGGGVDGPRCRLARSRH